jgi:hypothetical protein
MIISMRFESEEDVDAFLARFEAGDIAASDWTHRAHVAMACAYVLRYGKGEDDAAFFRIRAGIHHLNWHHGTITTPARGYHETLTVFWTRVLEVFCGEHAGVALPRFEMLNLAMEKLPAGLFKEYYGFDVVRSSEARQIWIAPDLRLLA